MGMILLGLVAGVAIAIGGRVARRRRAGRRTAVESDWSELLPSRLRDPESGDVL